MIEKVLFAFYNYGNNCLCYKMINNLALTMILLYKFVLCLIETGGIKCEGKFGNTLLTTSKQTNTPELC